MGGLLISKIGNGNIEQVLDIINENISNYERRDYTQEISDPFVGFKYTIIGPPDSIYEPTKQQKVAIAFIGDNFSDPVEQLMLPILLDRVSQKIKEELTNAQVGRFPFLMINK